MGFRDDIRHLKDIQLANPHMFAREIQDELDVEKRETSDSQYARDFAQADVAPYVESLTPKAWKSGGLNALVKHYIRIVGDQSKPSSSRSVMYLTMTGAETCGMSFSGPILCSCTAARK